MSMPTVSIIIPVYNVERYICQCLDSIEAQTEQNWECICIDDGSSDACGSILQEYRQKDSRFRIVHQKNQGVSVARNKGLDLARGKMIMMVDPDDWLEPDMMSCMLRSIESTCADLAVCGWFNRQEGGQYLSSSNPLCYFPKHSSIHYSLYRGECINVSFCAYLVKHMSYLVWNKIFRKEIIERLHLRFAQGVFFGEDGKFCLEYLTACKNIALLSTPLYNYRRGRGVTSMKEPYWRVFPRQNIVASINIFHKLIDRPPSYLMGKRKREFYSGLLAPYCRERRNWLFLLKNMPSTERKAILSQTPSHFWRLIQLSSIQILIKLYIIPRFRNFICVHIISHLKCGAVKNE